MQIVCIIYLFRSLGPWPNNTGSYSDALSYTAETERSRVHGLIFFHRISVCRPQKVERGAIGLLTSLSTVASQKEMCTEVVKNWSRKKHMSIKSKL